MTKIAMRFVTTTDIPIGNALVAIRLTRSDYEEKTSGVIMPRLEEFHTDANGLLQVDLMPATALYHVTVYDTVQDIAIHHDFIVPEVENPNTVLLLPDLIVPPDTVFSSQPYDEKALAIIVQAKTESVAAAVRSENSATSSAASALAASTDAAKTAADRTAVAADRTRVTADATQVATDKLAVSTNAAAALASKNAAATSAAEALASKNAAATSATGASGSATAAGTSATAASGSAATAVAAKDTAVTAKDQAAASQTAAANSAAAALVSQTSATQSATTATTAATTATTAKNDSLTYKDQAFQYMTSAQAAKGSAEGSAAAALASANSATASATTATGAATTATGARDVAVDAKTKTEAAWTDFDKRYFGAFAANPTVNAHGTAPVAGSMYWNIPLRQMNVFENGVWTPLPFTSTEVPLASALVRTQANGYIQTGLLDPNQTIYTDTPLAVKSVGKFGYTFLHGGQGQLLYKIATLPISGVGSYASLRIDAILGEWAAESLTAMTVTMGNRNGFVVDWSAGVGVPATTHFVVYVEADSSHSVYLMFNNSTFAQAAFNLQGMGCQSYTSPVGVSSVTGTAVWDSAAAPGASTYKAPRSIGMSPGKGTSFDSLVEVRAQDSAASSTSYIAGAPKANTTAAGVDLEVIRHGVAGNNGVNFAGFFQWLAAAGNGSAQKEGYRLSLKARDVGSGSFTPPLFSISGNGMVYIPLLKTGSSDPSSLRHNISRGTGQGAEILYVGVDNAPAPSVAILAADGGGGWSAALAVLYVGKNSTTNRGITTPGTVNAQGTDYAEYFVKALSCGPVVAGQLVGVDNKNQVTDLWADAVMFAIKSTDPSFVGGDSWSMHLGNRPTALAGVEPVSPTRMVDVMGADPENPEGDLIVTTPGDTDEEWEAKMADYSTAVAKWEQVDEADRVAMEDFDAKLEVARARVDRIAIAGRVPVNVLGAQPGDYIVPVQDGEGIKGIAVKEDDMTLRQYLRAVGQVITIEEDGRAYVMVKSV